MRIVGSGEDDVARLIYDTYKRRGWQASYVGRERWAKIIEAAILAKPGPAPAVALDSWSTAEMKQEWRAGTKKVLQSRYGIDPLTIMLISVAIRVAVELVIWWLNNRTNKLERAKRMREYLCQTSPR